MSIRSFVSTFVFLVFALPAHSQEGASRGRHELGVQGGSYLVPNATENLGTIGGRASIAINSNHMKHLELRGFNANTENVNYYLAEIGVRNEFTVEKMSAVWLLGFDFHFFKNPEAEEFTRRRGWHVGCGLNVQIGKNLMFRNDYILRFAPKMSLSVNLGFSWAFGDEG